MSKRFKFGEKVTYCIWSYKKGIFINYRKYKRASFEKQFGKRCRIIILNNQFPNGFSVWTVSVELLKKGW